MAENLLKHDCSNFVKKVFLVLDGELPEEEKKLFIKDIESCKSCLDHYQIEKSFKELWSGKLKKKNCSVELKKSILKSITEIQEKEK